MLLSALFDLSHGCLGAILGCLRAYLVLTGARLGMS